MVQINLKYEKGKWIETTAQEREFFLNELLKKKLDNIKMILKKNWDCVMLIDGKERAGKSTFATICGQYISNCELGIKNYASNLQDAAKKIGTLKPGSVLIIDEGSFVFGS